MNMIRDEIKNELFRLQDQAYRDFQSKLIPTVKPNAMIGVRTPKLRELAKQIQKMGEDAKVAIRNIRRDANDLCKKMKKDGEMTEDEQKVSEKSVQDLTDKYLKDVDAVTSKKEKEIMQI